MPERLGTGGGARGVGPGLHPHRDGAFDQACLGAVSGQQLGLALYDVRKLAFEGLCDAGVQRASRLALCQLTARTLATARRGWRKSVP